jgi:hypothetical protein
MLFVLFVVLTIISIVAIVLGATSRYGTRLFKFADGLVYGGATLAILFGVATVIALFIVIDAHTCIDGYVNKMNERRDIIVYQLENNVYENDNDIGKRELMVDIQEWNEDLAYKKVVQDDFWFGIFYPNIYDQFEFIRFGDVDEGGVES